MLGVTTTIRDDTTTDQKTRLVAFWSVVLSEANWGFLDFKLSPFAECCIHSSE